MSRCCAKASPRERASKPGESSPPRSAGPPAQTWWARSTPTGAASRRTARQHTPLAALRRHRLRARPAPPRAARAGVGALAPGGRGDPRTDARPHQGTQGDPRATRRDDREPAVRAVRAKPGGLGTALVIAKGRVRLGARGALARAPRRMGQDRALQRNDAPPSPPSCRKTSPNGARRSTRSGTQSRDARLHHPRRSRRRHARRARPTHRRLPLQRKPGRRLGSAILHPCRREGAQQPEFFAILGATPYSLRRGGISLRLRAEDPQTVASECGTSLRTLSKHYAYAIEDLRRNGPRPVDIEWRAARVEQAERQALGSPPGALGISDAGQPRRKIRNWLNAHRRRG